MKDYYQAGWNDGYEAAQSGLSWEDAKRDYRLHLHLSDYIDGFKAGFEQGLTAE